MLRQDTPAMLSATRPMFKALVQRARQGMAKLAAVQISADVAGRLQGYMDTGYSVLAVLGGNPQSPGCAVHPGACGLAPTSGVLMLELQAELRRRGLEIPFRGMPDSDAAAWAQDLQWLRQTLAGTAPTL